MIRSLPRRMVDETMDAYVDWREECAHVRDAYRRWLSAVKADGRARVFAPTRRRLDREERASEVLRRADRPARSPLSTDASAKDERGPSWQRRPPVTNRLRSASTAEGDRSSIGRAFRPLRRAGLPTWDTRGSATARRGRSGFLAFMAHQSRGRHTAREGSAARTRKEHVDPALRPPREPSTRRASLGTMPGRGYRLCSDAPLGLSAARALERHGAPRGPSRSCSPPHN